MTIGSWSVSLEGPATGFARASGFGDEEATGEGHRAPPDLTLGCGGGTLSWTRQSGFELMSDDEYAELNATEQAEAG